MNKRKEMKIKKIVLVSPLIFHPEAAVFSSRHSSESAATTFFIQMNLIG
jgi:hypothetical protein